MAIIHTRISIILAATCVAVASFGSAIRTATSALDRFVRWIFASTPRQTPDFAFAGFGLSPAPQPMNGISAPLYQRNRHEAHSHARAADRHV